MPLVSLVVGPSKTWVKEHRGLFCAQTNVVAKSNFFNQVRLGFFAQNQNFVREDNALELVAAQFLAQHHPQLFGESKQYTNLINQIYQGGSTPEEIFYSLNTTSKNNVRFTPALSRRLADRYKVWISGQAHKDEKFKFSKIQQELKSEDKLIQLFEVLCEIDRRALNLGFVNQAQSEYLAITSLSAPKYETIEFKDIFSFSETELIIIERLSVLGTEFRLTLCDQVQTKKFNKIFEF